MRWDELFADLEGQLDAAERRALDAEVADRTRRETALVPLTDRLRAAVGTLVTVLVRGAGRVSGRLVDVGAEWLLLEERPHVQTLVPAPHVLSVVGLGSAAAPPLPRGALVRRLGLPYALRAITRDRAPVALVLVDGTILTGTLDRVGADHVDIAEHPVGEARRSAEVRSVRTVALPAIGALRQG